MRTNSQEDRYQTALPPYGIALLKESLFWLVRDGLAHGHRNEYQVLFILGGCLRVRVSGTVVSLSEGDVLMLPPRAVHALLAGDPRTPVRLLDLRLTKGATTHLTQFVMHLPACKTICSERNALLRSADDLARVAQQTGWRRTPLLLATLWETMLVLDLVDEEAPVAADPGLTDRRLRLAEAFMLEHLAEDMGVGDIAAAAGLSRSQITRLSHAQLGCGPAERLRTHRLETARRLLADGAMSVKEVARAVGFRWVHHFIRSYRQARGCTPAADRRTRRA